MSVRSSGLVRQRDYPVLKDTVPNEMLRRRRYRVDFARDPDDLDGILRMRFEVFNLELGEGLMTSFSTGRDQDDYDLNCHHLRVVDEATHQVVGTYRLQTSAMAARYKGFYSSDEFDLSRLPSDLIENAVEVGRACVAREHRNGQALFMLWRGLATYMVKNCKRYLFGCCSIMSMNPRDGRRVMAYLTGNGYMHDSIRITPQPGYSCYTNNLMPAVQGEIELPPLFRSYLRYGGKVCGPPAIDRQFKTIDFFVVFDVQQMDPRAFRLFFGDTPADS